MSEEHFLVHKPMLTFIGPKSFLIESFFAYVLERGINIHVITKDVTWKIDSSISMTQSDKCYEDFKSILDKTRYVCLDFREINKNFFSKKTFEDIVNLCIQRSMKLLVLYSLPDKDSYKEFVNETSALIKDVNTTTIILDTVQEDSDKGFTVGVLAVEDVLNNLYISLVSYRHTNKIVFYTSDPHKETDLSFDDVVVHPKPLLISPTHLAQDTKEESEKIAKEADASEEKHLASTPTPKKKKRKTSRLYKNKFLHAGYLFLCILVSIILIPLLALFTAEVVGNISSIVPLKPLLKISTASADFAKTYSLVLPPFMRPYSHFIFTQSSQTFLNTKNVYIDREIRTFTQLLAEELVSDGVQKSKTEDYSYFLSARLVQKYINNQLITNFQRNMSSDKSLYLTSYFINEVPYLSGVESPKVYIFVLYDTQKIMPVSGEVKSLYKVTFSGGSILDIREISIDEINEKIGEYVDVTRPMKEIFGEDTQYSLNTLIWDSHYPKVAQDTKWVLEKIFNQQTDGIIYIPENIIANKLKNAKDILPNLTKSETKVFFGSLSESLLNKETLVYLFDPSVESIVSSLNVSGEVSLPICSECETDFIGTSDIQTSDGKVQLKKQVNILYSFEAGVLKASATIFLKNVSETTYSGFSSLLTNPEVGFSPVEVIQNEGRESVVPLIFTRSGYKEAGVHLSIDPQQITALVFKWERGLSDEKEIKYLVNLLKQNGIGDYARTLEVKKVPAIEFDSSQSFTLTEGGNYRYNNELSADNIISFTLTEK